MSCLVIKSDTQWDGIDFVETFSPVIKMDTIRCILVMIVKLGWDLF